MYVCIYIRVCRIPGRDDFVRKSLRSLRVHVVIVSCGSEFMRYSSCYAIIYVCIYNMRP